MIGKYDLHKIPLEELVNNPMQTFVDETMNLILAIDLLEKAKNDLEYALKYVDYALHRGNVSENRNMISLAGIAEKNANNAAGKITLAVSMIRGDLDRLPLEDRKIKNNHKEEMKHNES